MRARTLVPAGLLGLVCCLHGSRWIVADSFPLLGGTVASAAVACAVGAVLVGMLALTSAAAPVKLRNGLGLAALGAGILAAPLAGAILPPPAGDAATRTCALCFVPFLLTVVLRIRAAQAEEWSLMPGMTGISAALLLFPLVIPESVSAALGLAGPALLCGVALSFWRGRDTVSAAGAAWFFGGAATALALLEGFRVRMLRGEWQRPTAGAVAIDVVFFGLSFVLLRRVRAMRFATVFLLTPLVTVVEGLMISKPTLSARVSSGVLLFVGAVVLVWNARPATPGVHVVE